MKYQIFLGVGMSAMLAACSPSSSNSGSSSGAAVLSVPSPVLEKADLAVVAGATSNALLADIPNGEASLDISLSAFGQSMGYVNLVGDFSAVAADASLACQNEVNQPGLFSTKQITFTCPHLSGTVSNTVSSNGSSGSGIYLGRIVQLSFSGSGDVATLSRETERGPYLNSLVSPVITRKINDSYTINGVNYIIQENSTLTFDNPDGTFSLTGELTVKKGDAVSESFVISSSADFHQSECGVDAGTISYKGPNSDIEIIYQGCGGLTVTANGEIVNQITPPPVIPPVIPPGLPNFPIILVPTPSPTPTPELTSNTDPVINLID